jgi:hypothetical protein
VSEVTERTRQPLGDGHVEAFLWSPQDLPRQNAAHAAPKDVLGGHAVQLEVMRNRGGELDEGVVEKWDAHFQ